MIASTTPATTSMALYNNSGTLYWDGGAVGGGWLSVGATTTSGQVQYLAIGTTTTTYSSSTVASAPRVTLQGGLTQLNSSSPVVIGSYASSTKLDGAYGVAMQGRYAFVVAANDGSISSFDTSDPKAVKQVGYLDLNVGMHDIYIQGNFAYTTTSNGVFIFDISNPARIIKVGQIVDAVNLSSAYKLVVKGSYAYVTTFNGDYSVRVIDISNPASPKLTGGFYKDISQEILPAGIDVVGNYAYFTGGGNNGTVGVLDISNPYNVILIATSSTVSGFFTAGAESIVVQGKYAYIGADEFYNSNAPISVMDISNPNNITWAGGYLQPSGGGTGDNRKLIIQGKYLYSISQGTSAIKIVDISNPTSIKLSSYLSGSTYLDQPSGFAIQGKYAYVASYNNDSLTTIDLGGIDATSLVTGSLESGSLSILKNAYVGDTLNVGGALSAFAGAVIGKGLSLTGISTSTNGTATTTLDAALYIASSTPATTTLALYQQGGTLYWNGSVVGSGGSSPFTLNSNGTITNGSTTAALIFASQTSIATTTNALYNNVGNLYWNGSLVATSGMVSAASLPASSTSLFVNTSGQVGIGTSTFATTSIALSVVGNIQQLQASTTLSQVGSVTISVASVSSVVKVSGRYAYTGLQNGTFIVTDISDPTSPKFMASTTVGSYVHDIFVQGNYAYVSSGSGLYAVDISAPNLPTITGSYIGSTILNMTVVGRYAYALDTGGTSIRVVDLSNPYLPTLVTSVSTGVTPTDIKASGKFLYVTSFSGGSLQSFSIANPRLPVLSSSVATGAGSAGIVVSDRYAYVGAASTNVINIIDIASSTNMFSVGSITALARPIDLVISGRYLYTNNDTSNSVQVYDVSRPTTPVLVGTTLTSTGGNSTFIDQYGKYLVVMAANTLKIFDTTGVEVNAAIIHSLESSAITSRGDMRAENNIFADNALFVGNGGILSNGALAIMSTTSTSYMGGGLTMASNTPATTANTLYNNGGLLYFNGSLVASQGLPASTTSLYVGTNGGTAIGTTTNIYGGNLTSGLTLGRTSSGVANSLVLSSGASIFSFSTTTQALYNYNGTLYWNGATLVSSTVGAATLPTYVGGVDTGGSLTGINSVDMKKIAISGRYEFVVGAGSTTACSSVIGSAAGCEMQIYDITNTSSSTLISGVDTTGSVGSGVGANDFNYIVVVGKYAYVASNGNATACSNVAGSAIGCELKVFDISNPFAPQYVGGMDASGSKTGTGSINATSLIVDGKYAYVTYAGNTTACSQAAGSAVGCEFKVFDISNPTNIVYVAGMDSSMSTTGTTNVGLNSITKQGRYIYIGSAGSIVGTCSNTAGSAEGCEVKIIDITNPVVPVYVGGQDSWGTQGGGGGGNSTDIEVQGKYLYELGSSSGACFLSGAGSCNLRIFDISSSTNITLIYVQNGTAITSMAISGRYLYTAGAADATACTQSTGSNGGCEIKIYDITNNFSIVYEGGIDVGGSSVGTNAVQVNDIEVDGKYIYITANGNTTACSQTAGAAAGCELQIYSPQGVEFVALQANSFEAGQASITGNMNVFGDMSANTLYAGNGGLYSGGAVTIMSTTSAYALRVSGNVCLDLNSDGTCTDSTSAISDENLKQNTATITDAISLINKLNGVTFDWKEDNQFGALVGSAHSLGFIAQQVQKVLPDFDLTSTTSAGYMVLDYGKIVAVVVNALHEMQEKFFSKQITTNEFCMTDEAGNKNCITKEQFDAVFQNGNKTSVPIIDAPPQDNSSSASSTENIDENNNSSTTEPTDTTPDPVTCTSPQTLDTATNICVDLVPEEPTTQPETANSEPQ